MSELDRLLELGAISALDDRLARMLERRAPRGGRELGLAGALASRARATGHSCVLLDELAGHPFPADESAGAVLPALPPLDAWVDALEASGLVGDGARPTPLVLDRSRRLYLHRLFTAERRVAEEVARRLAEGLLGFDRSRAKELLGRLFRPDSRGVDLQAVAAVAALRSRISILTGGPGTGKTTTVVRVLALLAALEPTARIAMAAPTGKAAARLSESLRAQLPSLEVDEAARARLPTEVRTIHRLLGYRPSDERFRFDRATPLPCDVLVVDEASMVDLLLMEALLAALPPSARVILLGDHEQLASVETGYVLGDLCAAARLEDPPSARLARDCRDLLGLALPAAAPSADPPRSLPLRDTVVRLEHSYRFSESGGIGALARAVAGGEPDRALEVLGSARGEASLVTPSGSADPALDLATEQLGRLLAAATPEQALALVGERQVLAALRRGPRGAEGLNEAVARWSRQAGLSAPGAEPPVRPVMVTANDYALGLWNGDLGVIRREGVRAWAWLPPAEAGGELRRIAPGKLPEHATAWAMTVHKSQGSEFGEVVVVLPPRPSPLLTRELLYTAVTRARRRVTVVGTEAMVRLAVDSPARRRSGLGDRLAEALAAAGGLG